MNGVEITSVEQALALSRESAFGPGIEINEPKSRMLGKAWDAFEQGDHWLTTSGSEYYTADALGNAGMLEVEIDGGKRHYRLSEIELALNGLTREETR